MLGKRFAHKYNEFAGFNNGEALGERDLSPEFSVVKQGDDLATLEEQRLQVDDINIHLFHSTLLSENILNDYCFSLACVFNISEEQKLFLSSLTGANICFQKGIKFVKKQ
jgi:hypothetical protein